MKFGSMSIATTNESGISRKKWLHGQWTDKHRISGMILLKMEINRRRGN